MFHGSSAASGASVRTQTKVLPLKLGASVRMNGGATGPRMVGRETDRTKAPSAVTSSSRDLGRLGEERALPSELDPESPLHPVRRQP